MSTREAPVLRRNARAGKLTPIRISPAHTTFSHRSRKSPLAFVIVAIEPLFTPLAIATVRRGFTGFAFLSGREHNGNRT